MSLSAVTGRILFALGLSSLMVIHARRKKSLSPNGAATAFLLGMITFSAPLWVFSVVLLAFFLASSKLTKFKAVRKRQLEADYEQSSERSAIQVIANGLMGGLAVAAFQYLYYSNTSNEHTSSLEKCLQLNNDRWTKILLWAYVGHYGCCAGDTWASELGILNKSWPILITKLKKVPPGTNGGVSVLGFIASLAGGAFVGAATSLTLYLEQRSCFGFAYEYIILGSMAGMIGSLVDSILGATVQESLYSEDKKKIVNDKSSAHVNVISGIPLLDNHQVNMLSSFIITAASAYAAYKLYPIQ
ncbi:integral membrane protein DUF92-domain-containing protein [Mycotypha africana]|uniref:integral membrane protein DUF92-domain-containing protein n=1 Tax=Mycotypha africana TaxID=64632 RepID=UPI002301A27A|nr:integral membrane protein DUF92-domain-containing protein [Mycotypha africana]KAI8987904.1 integral membrane protein DUF92-domain-containing protein [Mycotypha africana]